MNKMVGTSAPLVDARQKATGQAQYTDDLRFPHQLHVRFLRSPYAHARIRKIDTAEAERHPGVKAVVAGKDLPVHIGVLTISQDESPLAMDKVRYVGEIVAAVAGESEQTAQQGVDRIVVEYEPLRAFLDPAECLKPCAPDEPIHAHGRQGSNIHKTAELSFNDPEQAIAESPYTRTLSFKFAGLNHAFSEPLATAAVWNQDGTLTVFSATQIPHYLHRTLAKALGLPLHRIRVRKPALGGGFGGKSDPFPHEIITAYLAMKTGRPVKCRFSREEVFLNNHGRHPTEMTLSLGCDQRGILTGLKADIVIDGGAYASFGVVTAYYNGVLLQGPYKIDRFGFRTHRVYTNKPQCGAMRGHGAVNPRYAMELTLDALASQAGIDPCDFRMRNFLTSDTVTVGQLRITSNGVRQCLQVVRERSGWDRRHGRLPYGRGLGVACGFYISGSALPIIRNRYPQTVVQVKVDFDGRVVVYSGAADIGQGSDTMLALIVAETLGLGLDRIHVESADTLLTPVDLGSYSSRVTFMVGNAAKQAAERIRSLISQAVAREKQVEPARIRFQDGRVFTSDRGIDLSWDEAVEAAQAGKGALFESGNYISPQLGGSFKGAGAGLSPSYSFGAFLSEVEVNPRTGHVRVVKVWGAHDCGRALNRLAVEGQIEGCIHMGLGQALFEELRPCRGLFLNTNFLDYRVPTALDTPEMDITIIESNDPEGPFGAKEAGEGPIHPVLPSIGNAIYDAVGVRILELPITPDKVLQALQNKNERQGG